MRAFARELERGDEVDAQRRREVFGGLVERGRRLAAAGVVHEHVDLTVVRERGGHERGGRAVFGQIARHGVRVA